MSTIVQKKPLSVGTMHQFISMQLESRNRWSKVPAYSKRARLFRFDSLRFLPVPQYEKISIKMRMYLRKRMYIMRILYYYIIQENKKIKKVLLI